VKRVIETKGSVGPESQLPARQVPGPGRLGGELVRAPTRCGRCRSGPRAGAIEFHGHRGPAATTSRASEWSAQAFLAATGGRADLRRGGCPSSWHRSIRRIYDQMPPAQMGDLDGGVRPPPAASSTTTRMVPGHRHDRPGGRLPFPGCPPRPGRLFVRRPPACTRKIKGESLFDRRPTPRGRSRSTARGPATPPPRQIDEIFGAVRQLRPPVPLVVKPVRSDAAASDLRPTAIGRGLESCGEHDRLRRARRRCSTRMDVACAIPRQQGYGLPGRRYGRFEYRDRERPPRGGLPSCDPSRARGRPPGQGRARPRRGGPVRSTPFVPLWRGADWAGGGRTFGHVRRHVPRSPPNLRRILMWETYAEGHPTAEGLPRWRGRLQPRPRQVRQALGANPESPLLHGGVVDRRGVTIELPADMKERLRRGERWASSPTPSEQGATVELELADPRPGTPGVNRSGSPWPRADLAPEPDYLAGRGTC